MSDLIYTSKASICKVCKGDHRCSETHDGLILCVRSNGEVDGFIYLGPASKDPSWSLYRVNDGTLRYSDSFRPRIDDNSLAAFFKLQKAERAEQAKQRVIAEQGLDVPEDWNDLRAMASQYHVAAVMSDTLPALAKHLGVSVASLLQLNTGSFLAEAGVRIYTFPETYTGDFICAIVQRHPDGSKPTRLGGHNSGLFVPSSWSPEHSAPLHLVEGPSDTAALLTMDLRVLGRPNNAGGVESLAERLADVPPWVPVYVVGDNDRNDAKGTWPGRDAAIATAKKLCRKLGRPIHWTMPPVGIKDSRAWLNAQGLDPEDTAACHVAGQEYQRLLIAAAVEITPEQLAGEDLAAAEEKVGQTSPSDVRRSLLDWIGHAEDVIKDIFISTKEADKHSDCQEMEAQLHNIFDPCLGFCGRLFCGRIACEVCRLRGRALSLKHSILCIAHSYHVDNFTACILQRIKYKPDLRTDEDRLYAASITEDEIEAIGKRRKRAAEALGLVDKDGWLRVELPSGDSYYLTNMPITDEPITPAEALRRVTQLIQDAPRVKSAVRFGGAWAKPVLAQWKVFHSGLDNDELRKAMEPVALVKDLNEKEISDRMKGDFFWRYLGEGAQALAFYEGLRPMPIVEIDLPGLFSGCVSEADFESRIAQWTREDFARENGASVISYREKAVVGNSGHAPKVPLPEQQTFTFTT